MALAQWRTSYALAAKALALAKSPLAGATVGIKRFSQERDAAKATQVALEMIGGIDTVVKLSDTVVIKPNWVIDHNPKDKNTDSIITHTSVIRVLLDYVCLALDYRGKVVIADAPLQSCNFARLLKLNRAAELVKIYSRKFDDMEFSIVDLRKTVLKSGRTKKHLKSI